MWCLSSGALPTNYPDPDQIQINDQRPNSGALSHILGKFQMAITLQIVIRSPSCLVLGRNFRDGGSNGAISGWIKSKMAAGGYFEKVQTAMSLKYNIPFTLRMYTDPFLSDSIMTVDAWQELGHLFHKSGSLADLRYKEKEWKGTFGEIYQNVTREDYTLDWSQCKV